LPFGSFVLAVMISVVNAPSVSLVIYVNLGCYRAYIKEGLPILRDGTERAKGKFKSVLVMWEGTLYKLWEDGKT
jgi:hypothetical protein